MAMKLLATNTASNAASSSFTSSISSTYKLYIFKFYDVNPATDNVDFGFQVNATDDAGGGYDTSTITSTFFYGYHDEADSATGLDYDASYDQAEGTAFQTIAYDIGNGADESTSGTLWLFNPASTVYIKHFYSRFSDYLQSNYAVDISAAGYINYTTAIDDIQFKMSSGNMDAVIKLYGVA